ncbi:protein kinase family protein [Enterovibrio norvegicus]|uniref:hypothetical protein n=1 Tax=Enterovibrio norvegicus TaxID=188144 RepID=UPI003550757A
MNLFDLPPTSLVEFETYKLKNSSLCWINTSVLSEYGFDINSDQSIKLAGEEIVQMYAYIIPASENSNIDTSQRKIFHGDIYGSEGEISNLGGVRCGADRLFQIKGIGQNPLVGEYVEFWHSHGGCTLEEAIREAFWSYLFEAELTYGANRVVAIIATGDESPFDIDFESLRVPCKPKGVLIVREHSIRPAHFARVVYCTPKNREKFINYSDVKRTSNAISYLTKFLPSGNTLVDQLENLAKRYAKTAAELKSRRICHGAITPSNICIDGKLVDFGTATALPSYMNYQLSESFPPFWGDHYSYYGILDSLIFQINKDTNIKINSGSICELFFAEFEKNLEKEFAYNSGFSRDFIEQNWSIVKSYASKLVTIARENEPVRTKLYNYCDKSFKCRYEETVKFIYELIDNDFSIRNDDFVDLKEDLKRLWHSYIAFNAEIKTKNLKRHFLLNNRKRNKIHPHLYRDFDDAYEMIFKEEISQKTDLINLHGILDKKLSNTLRFSKNIIDTEALIELNIISRCGIEIALLFDAIDGKNKILISAHNKNQIGNFIKSKNLSKYNFKEEKNRISPSMMVPYSREIYDHLIIGGNNEY